MKVIMQLSCESDKQKNDVYEVIKLIADQEKLQLEERDEHVVIDICPQGIIECKEDGNQVILTAHTSHGGPGFHAYCINLMEWIEEECELQGTLKDDCGYVENPDFQRLKYEVFYPWLSDLKRLIMEGAMQHQNYYFDETHYLPVYREDVVITPCGFIDRQEFEAMDTEQLAPYFFLWNNEERDALFYKSCALHLLAKEGYGAYAHMNEQSEKFSSSIVDFIEIAHQKDSSISLPLHAYHELCTQLGREACIEDGIEMDEEVCQYRQQEVYHIFHEWSIYAPGCCERSYDVIHDELYLMAPYKNENCGWEWMWKIASHMQEPSHWENVKNNGVHWHNETLNGTTIIEEEADFYHIRAILQAEHPLYVEIIIREEKDIAYLKACLQQCQHALHRAM